MKARFRKVRTFSKSSEMTPIHGIALSTTSSCAARSAKRWIFPRDWAREPAGCCSYSPGCATGPCPPGSSTSSTVAPSWTRWRMRFGGPRSTGSLGYRRLRTRFTPLPPFRLEPRSVLGSCGVASRMIGGWRVDPVRPAVIVGTVDIVSSRLPFSGYGDGRSRRSMHAGSLGYDAVVVVDEGHLSPAMGELLRASSRLQDRPEFRSMRLSAGSAATGPARSRSSCRASHT